MQITYSKQANFLLHQCLSIQGARQVKTVDVGFAKTLGNRKYPLSLYSKQIGRMGIKSN
jgi:hypothetical protein